MTKEIKPIDYSQLTLPEVIKRKTHRKTTFFGLDTDSQRGVLDYIKKHKIDIKIFTEKWYDILTDKFSTVCN